MILSMNAYRSSLQDFLKDRRRNLADLSRGVPWLLFAATPIYVEREKLDPLRTDIRDLIVGPPRPPDDRYEGVLVGRPKPRLFGIEACSPERTSEPCKMIRLFRNGHLEYCHKQDIGLPKDWPNTPMMVSSYWMTVMLLNFLELAKRIMQLGEITEPIAITACWQNFNPSYLQTCKDGSIASSVFGLSNVFVWREESLNISLTVAELSNPNEPARSIIDRLCNAFGYEANPHFDDKGDFAKG